MMFTGDAQGNLVTCIFYNTSGSMEARKKMQPTRISSTPRGIGSSKQKMSSQMTKAE